MREQSQLGMHGGFAEMEGIIEKERQRFKEVRESLQNELNQERTTRIEFENKLIKIKDEFSKKQIIISELQFRQNSILHQNQDLSVENDKLREELARLEDAYSSRIYELEGELSASMKNLEQTSAHYSTEYEKFKKQGQEYIQSLSFEYERKIKALEEKLKVSETNRKDLSFDNKRLNDLLTQSKMNFEEEVRDLTNRMRDEEQKKMQMITKSFEQRLRAAQESKEMLNRKCQEYMKAIQDKERELEAKKHEQDSEIERLHQDIADQANRNHQLTFLIQKLKSQLQERDSVLKRHTGQVGQEQAFLRQQLESKRKENETLNQTIRELRSNLKDVNVQNQRKRAEIIEKMNYFQSQARRYRDDYTKLHSSLKTRINQTINNFSQVQRG